MSLLSESAGTIADETVETVFAPFIPVDGYERIVLALVEREQARKSNDYYTSDLLRSDLEKQGWNIEDGVRVGLRASVTQKWIGNLFVEIVSVDNSVARRERYLVTRS